MLSDGFRHGPGGRYLQAVSLAPGHWRYLGNLAASRGRICLHLFLAYFEGRGRVVWTMRGVSEFQGPRIDGWTASWRLRALYI